jgi:hypothetical protein
VAKRQGIYEGGKPGTTKGKPDGAREPQAKELAAEITTAFGVSTRMVFRYLGE